MFNIYLDTDTNDATGYKNSTAIGADYLLQGNILYQYTGTAGEWNWTALGNVPLISNGTTAEIALDRATIGDPALLNLIIVGDNLSLSTPGTQSDHYPDTIYDPNATKRSFSYSIGGVSATT